MDEILAASPDSLRITRTASLQTRINPFDAVVMTWGFVSREDGRWRWLVEPSF